MLRKKGRKTEEEEAKIDISSLIDVCFLLLIYFIVTSIITEPESDLVIKLPAPHDGSSEFDIDPMMFQVDANGAVTQIETDQTQIPLVASGHPDGLHQTPEELPELNQTVRNYASIARDRAMIQLDIDTSAKAQHVVDVLNVLSKHGIKNIAFTKKAFD